MKEKVINSVVIIVLVIVMAALIIPWPRDFNVVFYGIKYQLGPDNQNYSELVSISFNGTYSESYFGLIDDRFKGYIAIDGVDIKEDEEFNLSFGEEKTTTISHTYYVKDDIVRRVSPSYGKLYIDEEFEALTIELYIEEPENKGFNSYNGFMISAPATNRAEALILSKELVPYYENLQ